jgi:hypothetical protein
MGLPASQRRILEKIENALRGSDPRLTSLFAIFSRLNRDEEMPRIEELRARASLLLARLHRRLGTADRRLHARPPRRRAAAFFFPLALVVVASSFVVAAVLPGPGRCAAAAAAAGAARHSAKVRNCKGTVIDPVLLGK